MAAEACALRFGRVEGMVEWVSVDVDQRLRLTVFLETSSEYKIVRQEILTPSGAWSDHENLFWLADQYTQETLGVDLAAEGWEVIGAGTPPDPEVEQIARSTSYAVRKL